MQKYRRIKSAVFKPVDGNVMEKRMAETAIPYGEEHQFHRPVDEEGDVQSNKIVWSSRIWSCGGVTFWVRSYKLNNCYNL